MATRDASLRAYLCSWTAARDASGRRLELTTFGPVPLTIATGAAICELVVASLAGFDFITIAPAIAAASRASRPPATHTAGEMLFERAIVVVVLPASVVIRDFAK